MTWLQMLLIFLPLAVIWNLLRRRKFVPDKTLQTEFVALPVSVDVIGYAKALTAWLFLFTRTFTITPGVYYMGTYDPEAPLLVTGNYFLTLFSLRRRLGNRNVRILVIDTEGINVWCSSGKGKFSAVEIIEKARACHLLAGEESLRLILPKFSMAGVKLNELRSAGIKPVIGPLYAKDLPTYLEGTVLRHRTEDKVRFNLEQRFFTAVPTAIQFFYNFLGIYVVTLGWLDQIIVMIAVGLAFFYPLLFPYLPGKLFATKGISLGIIMVVLFAGYYSLFSPTALIANCYLAPFIFATAILVGLGYTGNSPISNYSRVREEIAAFLPVIVIAYILALVLYVVF